ncbi:MAG: hypothetical protein, partial [Olavius algarvensis Gamma 1 endosymbiont]
RNSLTVGSLKKINNLFIKDIFHGYCLKRQSLRVSPCSGCETGHPSPPFALRSGDNLYVPRTP